MAQHPVHPSYVLTAADAKEFAVRFNGRFDRPTIYCIEADRMGDENFEITFRNVDDEFLDLGYVYRASDTTIMIDF